MVNCLHQVLSALNLMVEALLLVQKHYKATQNGRQFWSQPVPHDVKPPMHSGISWTMRYVRTMQTIRYDGCDDPSLILYSRMIHPVQISSESDDKAIVKINAAPTFFLWLLAYTYL